MLQARTRQHFYFGLFLLFGGVWQGGYGQFGFTLQIGQPSRQKSADGRLTMGGFREGFDNGFGIDLIARDERSDVSRNACREEKSGMVSGQ